MLEFTCPQCSKCIQVDDSFLGSEMRCAACNTLMPPTQTEAIATKQHAAQARIVAAATVAQEAFRAGEPPLPQPHPPVLVTTILASRSIVCLITAGVLLTALLLLFPAIQKSREAALRSQSTNHLKEIGIGVLGFHDQFKRFPFNGTREAVPGDPTSGSWAYQILPMIDHKALFTAPDNETGVAIYMCPGRGRPLVSIKGAWTDYFINPWINNQDGSPSAPDIKRGLFGITDGASNTIFLGHGSVDPRFYSANETFAQSTSIFKGGHPGTARRETTNHQDKRDDVRLTWGSSFPKGALMCLCDGSLRYFVYEITGGTIHEGVSNGVGQWGFNLNLGVFLTPVGNEFAAVNE